MVEAAEEYGLKIRASCLEAFLQRESQSTIDYRYFQRYAKFNEDVERPEITDEIIRKEVMKRAVIGHQIYDKANMKRITRTGATQALGIPAKTRQHDHSTRIAILLPHSSFKILIICS